MAPAGSPQLSASNQAWNRSNRTIGEQQNKHPTYNRKTRDKSENIFRFNNKFEKTYSQIETLNRFYSERYKLGSYKSNQQRIQTWIIQIQWPKETREKTEPIQTTSRFKSIQTMNRFKQTLDSKQRRSITIRIEKKFEERNWKTWSSSTGEK